MMYCPGEERLAAFRLADRWHTLLHAELPAVAYFLLFGPEDCASSSLFIPPAGERLRRGNGPG